MSLVLFMFSFAQAAEPIVHYAFDGDVTDSSASANDGVWTNSSFEAYNTTNPAVGTGALILDANDPNSFISLGKTALPNPDNNIRTLGSAAFWIKTTTTDTMAVCGVFNSSNSSALQIMVNDGATGKIAFYLRSADGSRTAMSGIDSGILDGNWHHVAFVWDYEAVPNTSMYIDAQLLSTMTEQTVYPSSPLKDWEYPMALGARNLRGVVDSYFTGELDNFKIFNVALTSDEVTTEYLEGPEDWACRTKPEFDLNDDCIVDLADFALFADAWLSCTRIPVDQCN